MEELKQNPCEDPFSSSSSTSHGGGGRLGLWSRLCNRNTRHQGDNVDPQNVEQAVFTQNLFNSGVSLAAFAASLAAVYRSFRREPPLSETVIREFATKSDLHELRQELQKIQEDMNKQLRSGDKCFKDLERVIGKLEGAMQFCPYLCGRVPHQKGPSHEG
jgi:hypothetical protein